MGLLVPARADLLVLDSFELRRQAAPLRLRDAPRDLRQELRVLDQDVLAKEPHVRVEVLPQLGADLLVLLALRDLLLHRADQLAEPDVVAREPPRELGANLRGRLRQDREEGPFLLR